ncbi:MAG TPA: undecaprenyldiphospho-muramoylpentapeptide beta-N-acetylglucosaminyltransferase [Acidobacteriaceae bacterium]|nr:undecaprenyldiphospho-muramoylpentapeptide beta-N-acetylglucosaminyltransferase [Acidobacteriaceae bacterium]
MQQVGESAVGPGFSPDSAGQPVSGLRVVIAGGGTGGHVIPALAIGRELRDKHGADVLFIGTSRGLETKLVPEAGFRLELVRSGQLKNVSLKTRLKTFGDLPLGVLHCMRLLKEFQPQVVVGVGGYASGPAMIAALLKRIPTLAYEPNAVPGMTNKLLGKRVGAAAVNFAVTVKFFRNAEITGVPVRQEIFDLPPRPAGAAPRLLVTAGSQGAAVFNDVMPRILPGLLRQIPGLTIVHQAGARHLETTRAAFEATGADPARWRVEAFLTDMPVQYAAADLILARSGSTVAELCAAGKPSLLVPFPQAADDHQRKNAEVLATAGAAVMLLQRDATPETMERMLVNLLQDPEKRMRMAAAAKKLARSGALERIAGMVLRLAARQ